MIPALAAIGLMLSTGSLGCLAIWRRMAYFGDAISHAAVLGIALSLTTSWPLFIGIFCCSAIMALFLSVFEDRRGLTSDTLLGVIAHTGLAFGLVIVSILHNGIDLEHYLLGDIMTITTNDLLRIWGTSIFVLITLTRIWNPLLLSCLSTDLAHAAGLSPYRYRMLLSLILALMISMAIQIAGILLVTALLIIPAATVRLFCKSPESMAVSATLVGIFSSLAGIYLAIKLHTPAGPTIIVIASTLFAAACFFKTPTH